MDTVVLVNSENCAVGDGIKGEKMASAQRKRLADISNLQRQFKPTNQVAKQKSTTLTPKESYVEKLHKENTELMKLLVDRKKLIELSTMELQKLRTNFQKVQLQNLQLAQENSQMLAELNSGKDRLKVLQHELGCKNGLLKARILEAGETGKRVGHQNTNTEACSTHHNELGESSQADTEDKPSNANQRKKSRNQSLGPPAVKAVHVKEETDRKRRCSRRQSARFKSKESETIEDLYEMDGAKFLVSSLHCDSVDESGQTLPGLSVKKDEENATTSPEAQETRRSSVGRPMRRATEKVQSYKEIPLNTKLRRTE